MEPTETLLERSEQLQGEHRRFLERKQKLFAVHLDHLAIPESTGRAMAAVIMLNQSTHTKHLARKEDLPSTVWPIERHLTSQNAKDRIAGITGLIKQLLGVKKADSQAAGQGLNRMQS